MTSTLPPVARNINVFCKKCNADRYFKVITHTSDTTAKLKCEVCGCSRKYTLDEEKKPSVAVSKKTSTKSASKKSSSASAWLTMKEKYEGPEAQPYTVVSQFKDKQSLVHPTFGVGYVTKVLPHKIEVLFAEGIKELMHARK